MGDIGHPNDLSLVWMSPERLVLRPLEGLSRSVRGRFTYENGPSDLTCVVQQKSRSWRLAPRVDESLTSWLPTGLMTTNVDALVATQHLIVCLRHALATSTKTG